MESRDVKSDECTLIYVKRVKRLFECYVHTSDGLCIFVHLIPFSI